MSLTDFVMFGLWLVAFLFSLSALALVALLVHELHEENRLAKRPPPPMVSELLKGGRSIN